MPKGPRPKPKPLPIPSRVPPAEGSSSRQQVEDTQTDKVCLIYILHDSDDYLTGIGQAHSEPTTARLAGRQTGVKPKGAEKTTQGTEDLKRIDTRYCPRSTEHVKQRYRIDSEAKAQPAQLEVTTITVHDSSPIMYFGRS